MWIPSKFLSDFLPKEFGNAASSQVGEKDIKLQDAEAVSNCKPFNSQSCNMVHGNAKYPREDWSAGFGYWPEAVFTGRLGQPVISDKGNYIFYNEYARNSY